MKGKANIRKDRQTRFAGSLYVKVWNKLVYVDKGLLWKYIK